MTSSPISVKYDRASDVLYIVTPQNAPAVAEEDELGMVWRYAVEGGKLVGLTLIDFDAYWREHLAHVADEMAGRFDISHAEAQCVLESFHFPTRR